MEKLFFHQQVSFHLFFVFFRDVLEWKTQKIWNKIVFELKTTQKNYTGEMILFDEKKLHEVFRLFWFQNKKNLSRKPRNKLR